MTTRRKARICGLAIASAIALAASPASAYLALNNMWVQERPDGSVFVRPGPPTNDPAFWCAVGDYFLNFRRLPGSTPIFRVSEPPRHVGEGIVFSLDGRKAASKTGLTVMSGGPAGSLMTVTAFALCPVKFPFGVFSIFD